MICRRQIAWHFSFSLRSPPTICLPYHFDFKPTDIPYLTENNRNSDYK